MPKSRSRRWAAGRNKGLARHLTSARPTDARSQGLTALRHGDAIAAVSSLKQAVRRQPRDAALHVQLGAALRAAGHVSEAIAAYREALELAPDLAMAHNNLGNALRDLDKLAESAYHLETAITLNSDYAEAHYNLALTLARLDRAAEAERLCLRATVLRHGYPEAWASLVGFRMERADFRGALEAADRAVTLAPAKASYQLLRSSALEGLGRFAEADIALQDALGLAPNSPDVQFAHGRFLEQRGDSTAAAAAFRRARDCNPRSAAPYLALAGTPGGLSDEELAAAERLARRRDLPREERAVISFALARACERRKDFDRAFSWAREANAIERARSRYDEAESADFVARSVATFSAGLIAQVPAGEPSNRPIFIVGFPRSGTTLVEQIIASHPDAAAGGELVEIPNISRELPALIGEPYPDCVARLPEELADRLRARYLGRLDQIDRDALRITDKLPFNFRHLGLIARLFPNARVIHCRRDPRDVAVSCFFIKFHRPISFAQSLFDFATYWRHYESLMAHWRAVLPRPILSVDYETLVQDPEAQIRRIIEFSGLDWNNQCLNFHLADGVLRTASVYQARKPIYSNSVGRWMRYAKHLAPLYYELDKPRRVADRASDTGSRSTA
jgi:Flp pilus assembly protein TadD